MATISTTGVVDGQIIFAVHVTRIVNALDGTASNNIIINADLTQGSLTNTTNSTNSHAEGEGTIASGNYSHAEGKNSSSTGTHAHAEGFNNIASGDYSHAEGSDSESSGDYSHAEGLETISTGDYSHASGYGTIAYSDYQAAVGRFNLDLNNDDYFVVGVGADAGNRADGLGINDTRTYISNSLFLPNDSSDVGKKSGLPVERYQWHFQSNQFMDRHDRNVNIVEMLQGKLAELKDFFKPEFVILKRKIWEESEFKQSRIQEFAPPDGKIYGSNFSSKLPGNEPNFSSASTAGLTIIIFS